MAAEIVKKLIDAGIHFGHHASRWNPKMQTYIFGKKNLIHIINVKETLKGLLAALSLPPIRRKVPLWLALVAVTGLEFVYGTMRLQGEPRVTRLIAYELALSHYYDISRARRDLGYEPQLSVQEATERVIEDLKRRSNNFKGELENP